jgi:hypothetical protein
MGHESIDGSWGTSAADVDEAADRQPEPASGELIEVRKDFEADAMLLVKEFGDGETLVNANVGTESVGAQSSPMPKSPLLE